MRHPEAMAAFAIHSSCTTFALPDFPAVVLHRYEWNRQGGATYPTRFGYDTQGRRTTLSTTRDGSTWDETQWKYDAATGLCTTKEYADSSRVLHTFTPDGKPLRTTYASGRYKENTYNASRELVSTVYADGEATQTTYDGFSREASVSNSAATVVYSRDNRGNATNETINVGGETATIAREYDAFGRLVRLNDTHYSYAEDGKLATVSNALATVEYSYSADRMDAGYTISMPNGTVVGRALTRDAYRRSLVTNIVSTANGTTISSLAYTYDALNRPTQRNSDSFGYNIRSEVSSATISGGSQSSATAYYCCDEIGNSTWWTANNLNQYTHLDYDLDGNLLSDGIHTFTYDAASRLKTVSTNGVLILTNHYDAKSRRVRKAMPDATHTYFYDDWNLIEERVAYTNGTTSTIHYYWGKDLSGTFHHRFSTKYHDPESSLYYYGYRFYHPTLMRWLNRDPIEEDGGLNVYIACKNNLLRSYDSLGLWSSTWASRGDKRRVYKKGKGDSIKGLSDELGLDENTFHLWARIETGNRVSTEEKGKAAPSPDEGLKDVCYISVPNIWIEADLLRGGGIYDQLIVNQGGTIGSFFGQTLGRWGYHTLKPETPSNLLKVITENRKDIYGLTVYAHGSPDGYIVAPGGKSAIHQTRLIAAFRRNGYRIAEANMMQCYSIKTDGTIPTGADTERYFNYKEAWEKTAVKVYGYEGVNVIGIDF